MCLKPDYTTRTNEAILWSWFRSSLKHIPLPCSLHLCWLTEQKCLCILALRDNRRLINVII